MSNEPHIRRRQRRRRDPSVTDSQIKSRRRSAGISSNSSGGGGSKMWSRICVSACVAPSVEYQQRRRRTGRPSEPRRITTDWHTRTFYPLVRRPGGQRTAAVRHAGSTGRQLGGNATGRASQRIKLITARPADRRTDGRRQLRDRCPV